MPNELNGRIIQCINNILMLIKDLTNKSNRNEEHSYLQSIKKLSLLFMDSCSNDIDHLKFAANEFRNFLT